MIFLSCINLQGQVQQAFQPRFNETVKGDITIIANNVISRTATGNYDGGDGNHDFSNNVFVDIDNDPTTFNSSSANFSNPLPQLVCLSVKRAFIYWAAADKEPDDDDLNSDNVPDWDFNQVKLKLPGQANYSTITADNIIYRGRDSHFSNDPYICYKDITSEVLALNNAFGTYQVANVEAKIGALVSHDNTNTGTSGGWQIAFIYESPKLPSKNVSLFDGYAHVTSSANDFDISFNGFQTVSTGTVSANIVIGALEGDRDLGGDILKIQNTSNNFVPLSSPVRSADNFFNSRITLNGSNFLDRTPSSSNTLGFDSAIFELDNPGNSIIGNNQSSATLRLDSNQETYGLFLLGLSVDVWAPDLDPIQLIMTGGVSPANPGDNIGFAFSVLNRGNDDAVNLTTTTTLPPSVENVIADNLPAGITFNFDSNTGELTFNIADNLVELGQPEFDVEFELVLQDDCFFLEENCDLSFELQFTSTYNGVENPTEQTTLSSAGLDACNLGNLEPLIIEINQPVVQWATQPGELDRTIDCDNLDVLDDAQNLEPITDKCAFTLEKTSGNFVPSANTCETNNGTYTNTWTFTDACGVTIDEFIQTITIQDVSAPTFNENLPTDVTVECTDVPEAVTLTASDNCSSEVSVTFEEVRTDGDCASNYTLVRTWSATDDCDNTFTHTQTITVQDTTAPTFNETLPTDITVECDLVPDPVTLTANDNCAGTIDVTFNEVENDGTCPILQTIVRTWTATDTCGNTATHTQTITVQDTTAPTFNETLPTDITVECDLVPDPVTLTANDNCAGTIDVTFNEVENDGTCPTLQTIVRTWTATDVCGNTATHTQTITVQDTTAPTFNETLPTDITVECDLVPDPVTLTANDNCAGTIDVTFNEVENDGTCPTLQTIVRTWTATDVCGNTATHTQTITVQDTTAPTFNETLPTDITVECDLVPDPVTLTANDNCAGTIDVTFNEVENDGTCPILQTIVRTWTATDTCGNTATHTQTITVQDTTAPTFNETLPANITAECGDVPEAATLTASDNCSATMDVVFNEVDNSTDACNQEIIRTWTVTDTCGNTVTHTQTIIIQDNTAPVITAEAANIVIECDENGNNSAIEDWLNNNGSATATDNCNIVTWTNNYNGDIPDCSTPVEVIFTATDACGNTSSTTATYSIQDNNPPVIESNSQNVTLQCSDDDIETALQDWLASNGNATATDDCSMITWDNNFSELSNACGTTGSATVIFTATDACGNSSTTSATFTVEDTIAPTFNEELPTDITAECDAIVDPITLTASDACGDANVIFEETQTEGTCPILVVITRTWTATDECGNTTSHIQTITVEDTTAPTFNEALPGDITAECGEIPEAVTLTASDNCSDVTVSFNEVDNSTDACNQSLVRTWTATDACGNTATHTQTITIQDTSAPTFNETLPGDITAECGEIPEAVTLTASDNCSNVTVSFNEVDNSTDACNQALVRTWTATDACGNTATHTQTITIQDTSAPTFNETLPGDITAECGEIPEAVTLTASDNCSDVTVTFNEVDNSTDACNQALVRTWTATDACGNTATHTQTITIQDTSAPTFNETLPGDITAECGEIPEAVTLTASDNCSDVTVTFNEVDNSTDACNQALVRTWTATDACGNTTTHTQTITIQDTTAPTFNEELPVNITVECDALEDAITLTASDNCSDANVTFEETQMAGTCPTLIIITRTWTATDDCDNTATHTQTITVQDTTAPIFNEELPGDITAECGEVPEAVTLTASDNCAGSIEVTYNEVDTSTDACNQSLVRTWTATDTCGNTATHTQTITIQDTSAPVFNEALPGNITADCGDIPEAVTLTANDNCSTNATVTFNEVDTSTGDCNQSLVRTWTATDDCGNVATHTQTITIEDTTAPTFTVPADANLACEEDIDDITLTGDVTDEADNCSTGLDAIYTDEVISQDDCATIISRTWSLTDDCGNVTSATQSITIADTEAPIVIGTFDQVINVNCDEIPDAPNLSFEDDCSSITVNGPIETVENVTETSYTIIRTWTVEDTCNNVNVYTQTVNVTESSTTNHLDRAICTDEVSIDLFDILPNDVATDGTWEVTVGNAVIDGSIFDPTITDVGDYVFTYTTNAVNDCPTVYEIAMNVNDNCVVAGCNDEENVIISKAVTPNGDIHNENFEITGIEDCDFTVDVQIFNRWGALIYKSNDYQNNWNGFNPKASVGASNKVPTGTYYYIVKLKGSGLKPFTGPIYVGTK